MSFLQSCFPITNIRELKNYYGEYDYEILTFLRQATLVYRESLLHLRARHTYPLEIDFNSINLSFLSILSGVYFLG